MIARELYARTRNRLFVATGCAGLTLLTGLLVRHLGLLQPPPGSGWLRRTVYAAAGDGLVQIGWLAVVVVLLLALRELVATRYGRTAGHGYAVVVVKLTLAVTISLVTSEVLLRVAFHDGMSFGNRSGPFVRRFERDFVLNRYDGPSRGPEIAAGAPVNGLRVLVQGDSITWGQGVRREEDLFSSLLLERLRDDAPEAALAALARPGREIDRHLEQLERWGAEIRPEVIVYQWHPNDMELSKERRPGRSAPWRRLFFHPLASHYSYFWFLFDQQAGRFFSSGGSYADYLLEEFDGDTPRWREFETAFRRWAAEASSHTPRVLVALYPHGPGTEFRLEPIHARVRALCAETGVETLELRDALRIFDDDPRRMHASRFDSHPGAEAHAAIGSAVYTRIVELWPEVSPTSRRASPDWPASDPPASSRP